MKEKKRESIHILSSCLSNQHQVYMCLIFIYFHYLSYLNIKTDANQINKSWKIENWKKKNNLQRRINVCLYFRRAIWLSYWLKFNWIYKGFYFEK